MASLSKAKIDARNHGMQYVTDKYGQNFVNKYSKQLKATTGTSPGRSEAYKRQSILNKPPTPTGHFQYEGGNALYMDGGEAPAQAEQALPEFGSTMQLNLENDKELAQGHHTPWAQTTSISHLITSLLKQNQTDPQAYWDTWSQNNNANTQLTGRESSAFGYDVNYLGEAQMIGNNAYGGFGTNQVMQEFQQQEDGTQTPTNDTHDHGADSLAPYLPGNATTPDTGGPTGEAGTYNPWAFGQGGDTNSYGPNQQNMSRATLEAMQLANQYFAPQRMELAYELGDMETDMRRLAANLGRQVDDPVMQAKLYKEAMRAVRTMDVQQNTLALQMAEQRRREEMQNFQYYDALSQEEYKLRLANRQFYEDLGLRSAYFDLENSIGMTNPYSATTNTTGTQQQQQTLGGLYSSMLNYDPYKQGGNLL